MGPKVERIVTALKSAVQTGQNTWSADHLAAQDSRFADVWKATGPVPGWFGRVNAAAQFIVLAELRPRRIVEIGSYLGKSTVFYAKSLQILGIDGRVTSIDPHTGDRQHLEALGLAQLPSLDLFRCHLEAAGVTDYVETIVATSHDAGAGWNQPIDFLFVDGWHSYDAVMDDGETWLSHLTDRGIAVFDDATRYAEVQRAIDDLSGQARMQLYGDAFGQAYAGRASDVPASVRTVLRSYRPLTRHLPGHRLVR